MRRASLLIIALMTALPAAAQVYQWRDNEGRENYSDLPPAGVDAKEVRPLLKPSAGDASTEPATPAAKPKTMAEKELEFRERRAAAAEAETKAEQEKAQAAERKQACEQARNQLAALKSGVRMARFNASGEREVLDDTARAAETERTQKYVDTVCK